MDVEQFKPMTEKCSYYYTRVPFMLVKETEKAIRMTILKDGTSIWYPKKIIRGVKKDGNNYVGYFWNKILFENVDAANKAANKEQLTVN